jgi:hypothetical protein
MRDLTQWEAAYRRFQTFQKNLPGLIDENCVSEYHAILESLEQAGQRPLDFRIDDSKMAFRLVQARSGEHIDPRVGVQYSNKKYCDWEYFCRNLDQLQEVLNQRNQKDSPRDN